MPLNRLCMVFLALTQLTSWLLLFITSPLHDFNYHQLAPVVRLRHTVFMQQHFTLYAMVMLEAKLCT